MIGSGPSVSMFAAHNDWSWRIRYTALRALVRLCQGTKGDPSREGIHSTAYNTLLQAQSSEKDERVLEALKVGQVSQKRKGYVFLTGLPGNALG